MAGPMPFSGLVRVVSAALGKGGGVEVGLGLGRVEKKAEDVVCLMTSAGFWRIREGRKGRWWPWVLYIWGGRSGGVGRAERGWGRETGKEVEVRIRISEECKKVRLCRYRG